MKIIGLSGKKGHQQALWRKRPVSVNKAKPERYLTAQSICDYFY